MKKVKLTASSIGVLPYIGVSSYLHFMAPNPDPEGIGDIKIPCPIAFTNKPGLKAIEGISIKWDATTMHSKFDEMVNQFLKGSKRGNTPRPDLKF